MIKRKLFFLFEKLQIKRSERIAVTILLMSLIGLSSMALISEPTFNYDPEHYTELERVFAERSLQNEIEEQQILSRYEPDIDYNISYSEEGNQQIELPDTKQDVVVQSDSLSININSADTEELQKLPGIGPAYAERIIEWREENGDFTNLDQLLEIRGIGEKRLEDIAPHIILSEERTSDPE